MFVQFHCLSLYRNDRFPRLAQKAPGDLAKCLFEQVTHLKCDKFTSML